MEEKLVFKCACTLEVYRQPALPDSVHPGMQELPLIRSLMGAVESCRVYQMGRIRMDTGIYA